MKEQLISLETAKLAKEKGFDITSLPPYDRSGIIDSRQSYISSDFKKGATFELWYAPTQSLLQEWIKQIYGLYAYLDYANMEVVIIDYKNSEGKELLREDFYMFCPDYENHELLEKLLFEALKLIK